MIKRLLHIFLSVCYVFAGERPSPIESTGTACVAKGRVVLNMNSCTKVKDSNACVATGTACVAKNTPDLVVLKNPWSDMGLSPCSMHQSPPLYMVTLPHGQKIILLGTTHNFPLACMLPYGLAQDLIEQSSFTFNEIFGELFKGGRSKVDSHFCLASLPDFCYTSEAYREKIKAGIRACYEPFFVELPPEYLESEVDKYIASIFDENGKWYEKAGIVLRKISKDKESHKKEDYEEGKNEDPLLTHLVIKVNGLEIEVPIGKEELHPAALLLRVAPYPLPLCGGMDQHLVRISVNAGKPFFALEQERERWGQEQVKYLRGEIENLVIGMFKWHIDQLKQQDPNVNDSPAFYKAFYSDELPDDKSPGLLERNNLWILRIMELKERDFKLAFGYVGRGHLKDLFKKLEDLKGKNVERLSLADLAEILLDEPAILQEHARFKAIYRHL